MKKLLIMPPSFKRKLKPKLLPAIERYDGVLYRILRRNMPSKGLDILILTDNMKLVWSSEMLPYKEPKGKRWSGFGPKRISEETVKRNLTFLKNILEQENYSEIFIALGKRLRGAVKGIETISRTKISYIQGGLGFQSHMLKTWLNKIAKEIEKC